MSIIRISPGRERQERVSARCNFQKLQRFCSLEHAGARHVILHEIVHEDVESLTAFDMSHEILFEAAQWKCDYPDQIHFLQSNH